MNDLLLTFPPTFWPLIFETESTLSWICCCEVLSEGLLLVPFTMCDSFVQLCKLLDNMTFMLSWFRVHMLLNATSFLCIYSIPDHVVTNTVSMVSYLLNPDFWRIRLIGLLLLLFFDIPVKLSVHYSYDRKFCIEVWLILIVLQSDYELTKYVSHFCPWKLWCPWNIKRK